MARPLGLIVKAARKEARLTLRDVAEKSGGVLSFQTVHAIETGRTNVSTEHLDALADVLGLSRRVVREAAEREPYLGPFKLPTEADMLDREERAAVVGMVRALLRARDK